MYMKYGKTKGGVAGGKEREIRRGEQSNREGIMICDCVGYMVINHTLL
jgi:hypothetical protein